MKKHTDPALESKSTVEQAKALQAKIAKITGRTFPIFLDPDAGAAVPFIPIEDAEELDEPQRWVLGIEPENGKYNNVGKILFWIASTALPPKQTWESILREIVPQDPNVLINNADVQAATNAAIDKLLAS